VARLLAHGADAHRSPIEEVVQTRWTGRDVVPIGDAAHAGSPNMAQGAAMALEDALILADLPVHADGDVARALGSFAARVNTRDGWLIGYAAAGRVGQACAVWRTACGHGTGSVRHARRGLRLAGT
jgi:2-polyprenyl-6-methoxyphenol hydroxylase-like FAD-dependent oxidoreductase